MMKLFKKLLAVAMVAVLALTVLTGCDAGDASEVPSNATEARIYQNLNDYASSYTGAVLGPLSYRKDLSDVTYQKLSLWIQYKINETITKDEYDSGIKKLEAECKAQYGYEVSKNVDDSCAMTTPFTPSKADDFKPLYDNTNAYINATKVAIARIENKRSNGGDGVTYTMIECYREVN